MRWKLRALERVYVNLLVTNVFDNILSVMSSPTGACSYPMAAGAFSF